MIHFKQTLRACLLAFVTAALAVPALAQPPGGPQGGPGAEFLRGLSTDGRAVIRDARANADRGPVEELMQARQTMVTLMRADPLDEKALRKAMKRERELSADVQKARQEALLDAFLSLSRADRLIVVEGMERAGRRNDRLRDRMERRIDREALRNASDTRQ